MRKRLVVFAIVAVGSVAGAAVSVALAYQRAHTYHPPAGVRVVHGASLAAVATHSAVSPVAITRATTVDAAGGPKILFRNNIPDKTFGKLAVASLANPNSTRALADLSCDRVYFAGGNGLCLSAASAFSSRYEAKIFDASFKVRKSFSIPGIPSRARVSSDGKLGALTTFVNGDSYSPGNFSTRTSIVDMATGKIVLSLEQLKVTRNGRPFHNPNFNFWGVTFAHDDDHFFSTLGSGAKTYLVEGSLRARTMQVRYQHLECPSLSPDQTRIAFKRSLDSHGSWRLYVLDLKTMRAHPLAETHSVDDQVEWLDDSRILYWRGTDVWVVRADGKGTPQKFLSDASSPVVVR